MRGVISRRKLMRQGSPPAVRVAPQAASFRAGTGPVGVLLCHGFTGSPESMRPWAQYLADQGYRVSAPRLPGHGTHWKEMNYTQWTDWYARVEQEFNILRRECSQVFVTGLSMGGALALRLAQRYGSDVAGLVLVNPAVTSRDKTLTLLPVLSRILGSTRGITSDIARGGLEGGYDRTPLRAANSMMKLWADVRENLHRVDQPLLLLTSRVDHVVDASSAELIRSAVAATDVTTIVLENSFHVATLDFDDELIFAESDRFFRRHATPGGQPGTDG